MIRPLATLLALALPLAALAGAPAASSAWETSYGAALKKAGAASKPILFDFYTGWCPHCTRMEKTTWTDASLMKLASGSFVLAKVNADVDKVPVSRYRLTGYPTMIVATASGEQVLRLEGYVDAAGMKRALEAYTERADAIGQAQSALAKDKKDVGALLALADVQAAAGLDAAAAQSYSKIAKTAQGAELVRASAGAGLALTRTGKAEEARKILAKAVEAAGGTPSPALMLALGENELALGNAEAGRTWLQRIVAEAPSSDEAAAAKAALGG